MQTRTSARMAAGCCLINCIHCIRVFAVCMYSVAAAAGGNCEVVTDADLHDTAQAAGWDSYRLTDNPPATLIVVSACTD